MIKRLRSHLEETPLAKIGHGSYINRSGALGSINYACTYDVTIQIYLSTFEESGTSIFHKGN